LKGLASASEARSEKNAPLPYPSVHYRFGDFPGVFGIKPGSAIRRKAKRRCVIKNFGKNFEIL
jgi:hypothetical protein